MKKEAKDHEEEVPSGITRKDAILKMGKYAALTCLLYTSDAADE